MYNKLYKKADVFELGTHRFDFDKTIKIADSISKAGPGIRSTTPTFNKTTVPKIGVNIPVGDTVKDVLNGNVQALSRWDVDELRDGFKMQFSSIPAAIRNRISLKPIAGAAVLPKEVSGAGAYMCLQGLCHLSPGAPFWSSDNGRYATTAELSTSIDNNSAVPFNSKAFSGYVFSPELAEAFDYNVPGTIHLAKYGEGGGGHAVMNAGNDTVYEFSVPGLRKLHIGQLKTPGWTRRSNYGTFQRDPNSWASDPNSNRIITAMPTRMDPAEVAGQIYDMLLENRNARKISTPIISREAYIDLFTRTNKNRAENGWYTLPGAAKVQQQYKVAPGDSLWRLRRDLQINPKQLPWLKLYAEMLKANPKVDLDTLSPGQRINLPW